MKKLIQILLSIWPVVLMMMVITTVALAVVYNNRAQFQGNVNVVAASPGLVVDNPQLIFSDIAPGIWGESVPLNIRNTGADTYTSLRLESAYPDGPGLYLLTPPFLPLPPGGSLTVPLTLYVPLGQALGTYPIQGWVIGEK